MTNRMDRVFAMAETDLHHDLEEGTCTLAECNEGMRDLGREYRDALEAEAEEAYDDVMYQRGGF